MRRALAGAAAYGAAALAAHAAARRWDRATAAAVGLLEGDAMTTRPRARSSASEALETLPPEVAAYFAAALPEDQSAHPLRTARIRHEGTFRTSPTGRWSPFRSHQWYAVDPPGFVWDARIRMLPGVDVRVRDSYLRGGAGMEGRLAGLIPVVDAPDTPGLRAGSLHRYLAEAVWLPPALLPRPGLTWTAADDAAARVTLADAGTTVSLDVRFGDDGMIREVAAERFRDVRGESVPTPWVGRFRDYRDVDGLTIPMEGEVAWIFPEGAFTYWRGRVVSAEYARAP